jgi:hypothetical protein
MLSPRIPAEHVSGLAGIRDLDNGTFAKLLRVLNEVTPVVHLEKLSSVITQRLPDVKPTTSIEILATVLSLYSLMLRLDLSAQEIASDVCTAIQNSKYKELKLTAGAEKRFKERLVKLLAIESLLYTAKAPGIIYEHENVFSDCRIITDIRPIFGLDPQEEPKAAALVHTLCITCRQGEETKEFYIAMDADDLYMLNSTLERAFAKASTLEPVLNKLKLSFLKG